WKGPPRAWRPRRIGTSARCPRRAPLGDPRNRPELNGSAPGSDRVLEMDLLRAPAVGLLGHDQLYDLHRSSGKDGVPLVVVFHVRVGGRGSEGRAHARIPKGSLA